MTIETLKAAKTEAARFLARVKALEDAYQERKALAEAADKDGEPQRYFGLSYPPKETGAVRRASMDLTRALAALRRYE